MTPALSETEGKNPAKVCVGSWPTETEMINIVFSALKSGAVCYAAMDHEYRECSFLLWFLLLPRIDDSQCPV